MQWQVGVGEAVGEDEITETKLNTQMPSGVPKSGHCNSLVIIHAIIWNTELDAIIIREIKNLSSDLLFPQLVVQADTKLPVIVENVSFAHPIAKHPQQELQGAIVKRDMPDWRVTRPNQAVQV